MSKPTSERPEGAKILSPKGLIKGKAYDVLKFIQETCAFENPKTLKRPLKLLACTKQFGINFVTFFPYEYDDKSERVVKELNDAIEKGKKIRICYYGLIGNQIIIDILKDGEEIDQEKLEGIAAIEAAESNESPVKRRREDSEETSPSGKQSKA